MEAQELSHTFKTLCALAEQETLPRFRISNEIENKTADGFDPVTQADKQAEHVIRAYIEKHFPEHGIIGEEFGSVREDAQYCWIIDPVDGTRAFISGIPLWGTLIGLYRDGVPFAGCMHQPFTQELYQCDGVSSTYERAGETTRLETSNETDLSRAILMTTGPDIFSEDEFVAFQKVQGSVRMTRYSADCYAYCQLAAGNIGLVVEAGLNAYDIAALIPIIENAGGVITNWQGGSAAEGGQVLASANEVLHEQALALLTQA